MAAEEEEEAPGRPESNWFHTLAVAEIDSAADSWGRCSHTDNTAAAVVAECCTAGGGDIPHYCT